MKPWSDDELQAWLEHPNRPGEKPPESEGETVRMYRQLFDELASEPPLDVRYGFSARVVLTLQKAEVARRERRAYGLLGLCLLLMPLVALGWQAVFQFRDFSATVQALDAIKYPALFVLFLLALIQWADRRFVKRNVNN